MSELDSEGYAILFVGNSWKVTKGAMVITRGNKLGTFCMTTNTKKNVAVVDSMNMIDI